VTAAEEPARRPWRRAFWLIMLLAALIRVAGIFGQGFPESFYPDETNAIQRALQFGAERTADPGWFNKPALAYYLWFGAYAAFYGSCRLLGMFSSPEEFGVWAFNRVTPFLVLGRLLSTLFGLGTVWLTYLLGKRMRDRTLGLVAAFALTLTYAHVSTGQWVKEDVPEGFFHTAATVLLVSAITKSRAKDSAWSGWLGGLGMATKYYSVGLLIPAAFAHLFPSPSVARKMRWRVLLFALFGLTFLAGFFVGSPYNFLRQDFFVGHVMPAIRRAGQLLRLGAVGMQQARRTVFVDSGNLSFQDVLDGLVKTLWEPEGLGAAFLCLAAAGGLLALVRRRRLDVFMLVACLGQAVFLAVGNREVSEPRHLVVLYPLLAIWIADAVIFASGLVAPAVRGLRAAGIGCALVLVAALVPIGGPSAGQMLAQRSIEVFRGDTRLSALHWVETNLPDGASILNDHEVLPLRVNEARAKWAIDRLRGGGADAWKYSRRWTFRKDAARDRFRPTYDVLVVEAPWGAESIDALEAHRKTYDKTWPLDMESEPGDVAPVARYAEVPEAARRILDTRPVSRASSGRADPLSRHALEEVWPASKYLLDCRPIEWLVSSEVTYKNYEDDASRPERLDKRRNFPHRAAFYDDLKAHYDCRQWSAGRDGKTGPTIRIYDLRRRVSANPEVVEMLGNAP
jgi:4-amino-4-deoxy-L-arabinose transferase-like glycosyltransferase